MTFDQLTVILAFVWVIGVLFGLGLIFFRRRGK